MAQLNRLGTGLERGDSYRDGQAKIKVNPWSSKVLQQYLNATF
jgi:hypothetical protein